MLEWIVALPPAVGAILSGSFAIFIGFFVYLGAHATIGTRTDDRSADLAINMFRILATLLSLLLSLTFADVSEGVRKVRQGVELETAELGNVLRNLEAFDSNEAREISDKLIKYIESVVSSEWKALSQGDLHVETVRLFGDAKLAIFELEASSVKQELILGQLISDIDALNETRAGRLIYRGAHGAPAFLIVAIVGFVWTAILLGTYPPRSGAVIFLSIYFSFFGLVVYLILGLGSYFNGIGAVSPEPLRYLADLVRMM